MKILISGTTGLIGSALSSFLERKGHRVIRLVRRRPAPGASEVFWDPEGGTLDPSAIEGMDAVVHLAGESIAAGRWTEARKRRILSSRTAGTLLLARSIAILQRPPEIMVSASAIGYYGDRAGQVLSEESGPGSGFLADVCRQWEQAATSVEEAGTRLVVSRIGVVLANSGGALQRMLPPFRLGLGGSIGGGRQYMSWIAMDDLLETILFSLSTPALHGAFNAVAPGSVTNLEFTRVLAKVLRKPAYVNVPALAVRLAFGEMGEQVLLTSTRAEPARLLAAGFRFQYPDLESALRRALGA